MEKVKYTREEYRNEYLKSDEWNRLRKLTMDGNPDCQCCLKTKARDVHHLVYKNLVDIKIDELLPVCRDCHKEIHRAIADGYISQDVNDLENILQKTVNILGDKEYEDLKKWLRGKHSLSEDDIGIIADDSSRFLIKRIKGITKKQIWIDDLPNVKFTGTQIEKIKEVFKTFFYRRNLGKPNAVKKFKLSDDKKLLYKKIKKLNKLKNSKKPWMNAKEIDQLTLEIKELRSMF